MIALLIEWIPHSGIRAGNVNPKDPNLQCYGWQNMDVTPALELRIIEDDRDLGEYIGVAGITLLQGRDSINDAIDTNFPSHFIIEDQLFYDESVKEQLNEKTITIKDLPDNRAERLKLLKYNYHVKGIREIPPVKV